MRNVQGERLQKNCRSCSGVSGLIIQLTRSVAVLGGRLLSGNPRSPSPKKRCRGMAQIGIGGLLKTGHASPRCHQLRVRSRWFAQGPQVPRGKRRGPIRPVRRTIYYLRETTSGGYLNSFGSRKMSGIIWLPARLSRSLYTCRFLLSISSV